LCFPIQRRRAAHRPGSGEWFFRAGLLRDNPSNFLTILRCNFEVEARFADHGKLNTALRAPISATRLELEDAVWPNPALEK